MNEGQIRGMDELLYRQRHSAAHIMAEAVLEIFPEAKYAIGPPIENGVVLVRNGKIEAVGKDVAIPSDAKVIDATGKDVVPGFIEAHSNRGTDRPNETNPNVPFLSVVDSIDSR